MVAVDPDVPAHIAQFVDRFYKITDASDHDAYLAQFEPDAKFNVLGPRQGHDAILQGRRWSFANRGADQVHRWFHIWCPEGPDVAFVHGDNDFTRKKDGVFVNVPFIARMTFSGQPDNLRIKDYYVWVVSAGQGATDISASRKERTTRRSRRTSRGRVMHRCTMMHSNDARDAQ